MEEVRITAEPIDNSRCKFVASAPILDGGVRRFGSAEEAAGSPLAERIFAIGGVSEVLISGHTVTVTKKDQNPWQAVGRQVGAAMRSALQSSQPAVAPKAAESGAAGDDVLYDKVFDVFESRINPMVAGHGGRVDLIDVQDGLVLVRLQGGCQGCGMAEVTLRQGIESTLRQTVPGVLGVVDVTDHAKGSNPYFASSKK